MCLTSSLAQGPLFLPLLCIFRPSSCLHHLRDMQLPMVTPVASHASRRCSADSHSMFKTNAGDLHIKYHHQEWVTPTFLAGYSAGWITRNSSFGSSHGQSCTRGHDSSHPWQPNVLTKYSSVLIANVFHLPKQNTMPTPQKKGAQLTAHAEISRFFSQWKNNVCLLFFLFWMSIFPCPVLGTREDH